MPNSLWISGALYFGYYMALGSYMPFINLYYERMGLSGIQIGALSAIPVLVTSASVLIWGSIADAKRWHNAILHVNLVLAAGAILLLSTASTFQELIPFIVAYAFFNSPLVPLLDSSALEIAKSRQRTYGDLRVWGSIGWTISTLLVGVIIQQFNIKWLFYTYVIVMLITFLISLFLPVRTQVLKTSLARGLKGLILDIPFVMFLISIFLVSITLGAANAFFSIYLDSIGAGEGGIGLGWAISSISEIPVMLYSGYLLRRIGSGGLLKISFITFAIRWLLYSFIRTPSLAILVQVLHGLSYATYLIGSVTLVNERAPAGMSTSALSMLNLVSFGAGAICGSLLGGYIYETAGIAMMFRTLSLIAVAGFGIFLISQRRPVKNAAF
jgi:PPP family 3-phenylpropionic acid transporter